MRIGIDIGQNSTTVVLVRDGRLADCLTAPRSRDSLRSLLGQASALIHDQVEAVMIATSQVETALNESAADDHHLSPTAAIRIAGRPSRTARPFHDWPADLATAVGAPGYVCSDHPMAELEQELIKIAADIRARSIDRLALTGAFSPVSASQERWASGVLRRMIPEAQITLSHSLGPIGLLERENAAIFNASLVDVMTALGDELEDAIRTAGLDCPIFLSRYDGTIADLEFIREHPIVVLGGRRAAAARGAALLSELPDCLVLRPQAHGYSLISVRNGYPMRSDAGQEVHGVRTSLPHLDIREVDLGMPWARIKTEDRLLFTSAQHTLPQTRLPVVVLADEPRVLTIGPDGVRRRTLPVAQIRSVTALGAAMGEVGGECDRLLTSENAAAVDDVVVEAQIRAVAAGASVDSLRTLETSRTAVSHLGDRGLRVHARVVGAIPRRGTPGGV